MSFNRNEESRKSGLRGQGVSDPSVMLSPNARNLVALKRPGRVTVTEKVQDADCCWASMAVQLTVLAPTGKEAPLAGVQVDVSGCTPPFTRGDR
jgi:hypothetical protein